MARRMHVGSATARRADTPAAAPAPGKRPRQGFLMTVRAGRSVLLAKEGHRGYEAGHAGNRYSWMDSGAVRGHARRSPRQPGSCCCFCQPGGSRSCLRPLLRTDPGCLAPGAA